jgi:hypothetical protein
LERLAKAGLLLHLLNALYWAALDLPYEWIEHRLCCLVIYEARLREALRILETELQRE